MFCHFVQIPAVLIQGRRRGIFSAFRHAEFRLDLLFRHTARLSHRIEERGIQFLDIDSHGVQKSCGNAVALPQHGEKDMFRSHFITFQACRFLLGIVQQTACSRGQSGGRSDSGVAARRDQAVDQTQKPLLFHSEISKKDSRCPFRFHQESQKKMFRSYIAVLTAFCRLFSHRQGVARLAGVIFLHRCCLLYSSYSL